LPPGSIPMRNVEMKRLLLCCILCLLSGTPALGDDVTKAQWPQFRGPNRDGLSSDKGLLKEWPKDGPPVVWKATRLGSGYSSVTISGSRIFTVGNKGRVSNLVAIDRDKGKQLWTAKVGLAGGSLGCTPTIDGERAYAIGQEGDLVCVDVTNG